MKIFPIICAAALLGACQQVTDSTQSDVAAGDNAATASEVSPEAPDIVSADNGSTPAASAKGRVSRFTRLSMTDCKLVKEYEETGGWIRRCPDVDGRKVQWTEDDLRNDLIIGEGDDTVMLNSIVANGAFSSLGTSLDWRGPSGKAADALVVRVNVSQADTTKPEISRLAVVKLTGKPCVVAVVEPGPGQSDRARAIADGPLPGCKRPG